MGSEGIPESFLGLVLAGAGAGGGVSMASAALSRSASDMVASLDGGGIEANFLRGSRRVLSGCSLVVLGVLLEAPPNKMLEMALGNPWNPSTFVFLSSSSLLFLAKSEISFF